MVIRSKKTKLEHTIPEEDWAKIKARGDASKYIIVSNSASVNRLKVPEDTHKANYNQIVKDATKAFKAKQYQKAKELYVQADAIKSSDLVTEKLAQIQEFLDFEE